MNPARVLVADPPWLFKDALPGKARGASKVYRCLPLPEIMRFPLPELHDDALLFLWRVGAMEREALAVVEAWGFRPTGAELVWVKSTRDVPLLASPDDPRVDELLQSLPQRHRSKVEALMGPLAFGMGRTVRNAHEVCVIARRGKARPRDRSVRSVFFGERGEHSAKPDTFYRLVERMARGPRVELFARRRRRGWTCFGDQLEARP